MLLGRCLLHNRHPYRLHALHARNGADPYSDPEGNQRPGVLRSQRHCLSEVCRSTHCREQEAEVARWKAAVERRQKEQVNTLLAEADTGKGPEIWTV